MHYDWLKKEPATKPCAKGFVKVPVSHNVWGKRGRAPWGRGGGGEVTNLVPDGLGGCGAVVTVKFLHRFFTLVFRRSLLRTNRK